MHMILAADAARLDSLHVPAGLARLVGSAWHGGGAVSGLTALFWEPGRAQVALAVDQAIDGDFRAAAASTVEAVGVGVATGIALGELGAAAVDAVDDAASSKATSKIDRNAFKSERRAFWKAEAKNNPSNYSAEDLTKMEGGYAPARPDGHPMELHHVDRTAQGGLEPLSRTDHRIGKNYRKNNP